MKWMLLIVSLTVSKYDQKRLEVRAVPMESQIICEQAKRRITRYLRSHPEYEKRDASVDCLNGVEHSITKGMSQ